MKIVKIIVGFHLPKWRGMAIRQVISQEEIPGVAAKSMIIEKLILPGKAIKLT
jgi:hypothetical protein